VSVERLELSTNGLKGHRNNLAEVIPMAGLLDLDINRSIYRRLLVIR